ncbi:hypothetical protein [Streptomyces sp. NRRL F-4474]|uniref:hypothetical protein n=1 Tax=Streptomyces sp. NRRL F-4474 TaxID=1463851 RepID=UPI0004C77D6E|nr:hypothetical protein [Streptomyces sp. NRRL F-4474]
MDLNGKHRRTRTPNFPALLAPDLPDRQAWPGGRRLAVQTAAEEAEPARSIAEGLTGRAVLTPGHPHPLRAIARRRTAHPDATTRTARTARWADSPAADPSCNDLRPSPAASSAPSPKTCAPARAAHRPPTPGDC